MASMSGVTRLEDDAAWNARWAKIAAKHGVPLGDVVRDGVRYCRHHPEERIRLPAYPCKLCWKEGGDGVSRPDLVELAEAEPAEVEAPVRPVSSFWDSVDDDD